MAAAAAGDGAASAAAAGDVAASAAAAGDDCFCRLFGLAVAAALLAAVGNVAASAAAGDDCFCRFFAVLFFAMVNSVEAQLWWLLFFSDDVWCVVKNIFSEFS